MLIFVLGLTLLPFAQGFYSLLAAGLVLALANGLSTGIVMIVGMDLAPPDQRGQFLGVWRLLGDLGVVSGPVLAGVLMNVATLGTASFAAAGLGLLGAGSFLFLVPETLYYSQRNASIGSRFAARLAGKMPKNKPTPRLNANASSTDSGDT